MERVLLHTGPGRDSLGRQELVPPAHRIRPSRDQAIRGRMTMTPANLRQPLSCDACGDTPRTCGLIREDAKVGDFCPCRYHPDMDCDGTLVLEEFVVCICGGRDYVGTVSDAKFLDDLHAQRIALFARRGQEFGAFGLRCHILHRRLRRRP